MFVALKYLGGLQLGITEACIFGEGPYERRDRLRTIMAGRREAHRRWKGMMEPVR